MSLANITSYHNNIQKGSLDQVDAACLVLENGTMEKKTFEFKHYLTM